MADQPTELEVQVLGQLLGNLLSFALLLLGYLTFLLWRDYISTILCAFIVSQALHRLREQLVHGVRALRQPSAPPLLQSAGTGLLHTLRTCPPLPSLALLLLVLLLADYASWGWVGTAFASAAVLIVLPLWLLDRRVLAYSHLVSDESLFTLALIILVAVLAFVTAALAFQSLVDSALLLRQMFSWTRARVAPDNALSAAAGQMASVLKSTVVMSVETLAVSDHRWEGATHVVEMLEREANTTEVLVAISGVLRDFFPQNTVLRKSDEIDRLLLWVGGLAAGRGAQGNELDLDIKGAMCLAAGWAREAWAERPDDLLPALLAWLRPSEILSAWKTTGTHGSDLALFVVSLLLKLLYALYVVLSLGFSTIVFFTMTFYMLAAEQDAVTRVFATFAPRASESTVDKVRDTVEAVLVIPFNSAARNACVSLLLFRFFKVPYAHLGASLSIGLSLFPLAHPCLVCLPWVLWLVSAGRHLVGLLLLLLMVVAFWVSDMTAEQRLLEQAGVSLYVNGFSLVLGVYMFGLQGVLFGPLLVYGVIRIYEYAGAIIQQQAEVRPGVSGHDAADSDEDLVDAQLAGGGAAAAGAQYDGGEVVAPRVERRSASHGSRLERDRPDERRGSIELFSREVINTMRRLSFFSPPSRAALAPPRVAGRSFSASEHDRPRSFDVSVRCESSRGQQVRVGARVDQPWREFVRSIDERLRNAGFLLAAERVVGLRGGALLVASTRDLRPGEQLDALVETSAIVERPADRVAEPATGAVGTPNTRGQRREPPPPPSGT